MTTDFIIGLAGEFGKIPRFAYTTIVSFISAVTHNIRLIGILYLITGGLCIIGSHLLKKSNKREKDLENEMGRSFQD
jgi:uncharacterized membrane protein YdjX (TVP38/TMEM64 family)